LNLGQRPSESLAPVSPSSGVTTPPSLAPLSPSSGRGVGGEGEDV
jgi:hypothetical protein